MKFRQSGMTLTEVVIAMAIIAILAAMAFPSYQNHVVSSRRTEAQAALLSFANTMERYYTTNGSYLGAAASGVPTIFPTQAPLDGGRPYYNLTVPVLTATTYTLQAAPIAGTSQAGDGNVQITSAGVKSWNGQNCWDCK